MKNLLLLLVLITSLQAKAQYPDVIFKNGWIVSGAITSIGDTIYPNLPYTIYEFISDSTLNAFPRGIDATFYGRTHQGYSDKPYHSGNYIFNDSILEIHIGKALYKYKVVLKNTRGIIIQANDTYYFLEHITKIVKDRMIVETDFPFSKPLSHDTIFNYKDPVFRRPLFNFWIKKTPSYLQLDTSYSVKVSFILRKDKIIDSINISSSDTSVINFITHTLNKYSTKWVVAKKEKKKDDSSISFEIYIRSRFDKKSEILNLDTIIKRKYRKGVEQYSSGNVESACKTFYECEKISNCYYSTCKYLDNQYDIVNIRKEWINTYINQAAIYFQMGETQKACGKLREVVNVDDEAKKSYIETCKEYYSTPKIDENTTPLRNVFLY